MAIEKGTENNGKEQKGGLSQEKLAELVLSLSKQVEDLKNKEQSSLSPEAISAAVSAAIKSTREKVDSIDTNYERGIDESQIPADDFLDAKDAVKFFAPCGGYVICDDIRKGHRVLLPYGKKVIFFENPAVTKIQRGKYEELLVISEYTCRSKKELEWLRNHRLFKTKFFESTGSVQSADVIKMGKMSRIMSNVANYEIPDLLKAAKQNDVPISQDYDAVKFALAEKLYQNEAAMEEATRTKNFLDNSKDRMLFEKMQNA